MNRKQILKQIRNLSSAQCEQLGVTEPFKGQGNLKAVEAWLGDATLLDAEGNALELDAIFAEGDPAEVMLHGGMPAEEEAEEATEEAAEPAMADMEAMIKRSVRDAIGKSARIGLPRTSGVSVVSNCKKSDNFKSAEDQHLAGQWIGAKLLKRPEAMKWWNNNAPSGLKAQSEGTNSAGGFLVPDPLEAAIVDVRQEYGVCRKVAHNFPMTSDTMNIPSLTSGSTVYYPAENAATTESSAVWGNIACTATKRAALMKWSNELGADALFSLADTLSDYMGRALGIREDTEFIQGDGTTAFGSVTGLDAEGSHSNQTGAGDTWAELTLADLVNTAGLLGDKYHARASWIMSRQFYSQVVLRVIAAAGGNTIDSLGVGSTGAQLLGYGINFSDQAPTSTGVSQESCWFGDWDGGVAFADRSGIEIATSEHVNFAEDQINIRATSRYDIQIHDSSSFVALATAAT